MRVVVRGESRAAPYAAIPYVPIAMVLLFDEDPFLCLVPLAVGAARAAYWYAVLARRVVVETSDGLAYRGPDGLGETVRWADIREIRLLEGDRFPEWPRWLVRHRLPRVRVIATDPDGEFGMDLGQVLLRTQRGVDRAGRALAEAAARHGVTFVNAYD